MRICSLVLSGAGVFAINVGSAQAQSYPQPAAPPAPYQQPAQPYPPPSAAQYTQPQYQPPAQQTQYQPPPAPQYQQPAPQAQYGQPTPQPWETAPPAQYQASGYAQPTSAYSGVNAQGPIPEGAFQLGLGTSIVRYRPLSVDYDDDAGEYDSSSLRWGFAENPVYLELGYGLSRSIVLGGMIGLGGSSDTIEVMGEEVQDDSSFTFELGPKLDFVFAPGSKVAPFVGAAALVGIDSDDSGGGSENSVTTFLFLARLGLRAFLADQFSIDPTLVVGGGIGSGRQEDAEGKFDFSVSGFQIGLNVAVSGWVR